MNITLKLSGLYSSLFVIRFSLTFEKKFGGGGGEGTEKSLSFYPPREGTRARFVCSLAFEIEQISTRHRDV